jgi:hypothetical protein
MTVGNPVPCMLDIYAPAVLQMALSQTAFSLQSFKHNRGPEYIRPMALRRWVREMSGVINLPGLRAVATKVTR